MLELKVFSEPLQILQTFKMSAQSFWNHSRFNQNWRIFKWILSAAKLFGNVDSFAVRS